uniref:Uncharacterized protein n=1 Tax=Pararge aegeria TaxID=116150 RepID=S4P4Z6_9NEOP
MCLTLEPEFKFLFRRNIVHKVFQSCYRRKTTIMMNQSDPLKKLLGLWYLSNKRRDILLRKHLVPYKMLKCEEALTKVRR